MLTVPDSLETFDPVRSTRKMYDFFRIKNVVLTRVSVWPIPRVYTLAQE